MFCLYTLFLFLFIEAEYHYVALDDLELIVILPLPPSARITIVHHHTGYALIHFYFCFSFPHMTVAQIFFLEYVMQSISCIHLGCYHLIFSVLYRHV